MNRPNSEQSDLRSEVSTQYDEVDQGEMRVSHHRKDQFRDEDRDANGSKKVEI